MQSTNSHRGHSPTLDKEEDAVDTCPVCLTMPVQCQTNCGHQFCGDCPSKLRNLTCPMCRHNLRELTPLHGVPLSAVLPLPTDKQHELLWIFHYPTYIRNGLVPLQGMQTLFYPTDNRAPDGQPILRDGRPLFF